MKIALAFSLSIPHTDGYYTLFKACLRSILDRNKNFSIDILVFTDETLQDHYRSELLNIYSNIKFINIDVRLYAKHGKSNPKYYSIECFNVKYDKVIYTGVDVICLNPIDPIFKVRTSLGMPKEKKRPDMFSNGVMIIGKKWINDETYMALLRADYSNVNMFGTDMKLYNCFFKNKIKEVDYRFDVVNTEFGYAKLTDIIFLHYIYKPTKASERLRLDKKILNIWEKYNY
jgi:lipopolysaccharide biosynthesis glycosyltransferase